MIEIISVEEIEETKEEKKNGRENGTDKNSN